MLALLDQLYYFNGNVDTLVFVNSRTYFIQNGCRRCNIPSDGIALPEICRNDGYVESTSAGNIFWFGFLCAELKSWKCYEGPILG